MVESTKETGDSIEVAGERVEVDPASHLFDAAPLPQTTARALAEEVLGHCTTLFERVYPDVDVPKLIGGDELLADLYRETWLRIVSLAIARGVPPIERYADQVGLLLELAQELGIDARAPGESILRRALEVARSVPK